MVVDENGEAIIGATVKIGKQGRGTITDVNGKFSLNCTSGSNLTISYIGYKTLQVKSYPNMTVVLKEDSKSLDEVVVVGYGTVRKRDLTGSIQSVKSEDLIKNSPTSLEKGLQGRISGVNVIANDGAPGGGISIQVRGTNSFQSSVDPLYVIDGIPVTTGNSNESINFDSSAPSYQNALSSLNPNDILSVEVLKDASATAIYGSRGANGVVMITTKNGEGLNGKNKIELSYTLSVNNVAKRIKMLGAKDYAEYRNISYKNSQSVTGDTWTQESLPFPGMEIDGVYQNGPDDFDNNPYYWQNQIFCTGINHNLNLAFTGQSKNLNYNVSGGYLSQDGVVKNSSYDRYSVRANINSSLNKWVQFGTTISGSFSHSNMLKTATNNRNNGTEGVVRSALTYPPTYGIDDLDNEYSMVTPPTKYINALNENRNITFNTTNFINIHLAADLIYRTTLGYNYSHNDANQYWPSYLAEGKSAHGKSNAGDNWYSSLTFDNLLMYNHTFSKKHNISATIGTSWEKTSMYNKAITVQGFGTDSTNGWLLGDATQFLNTYSGKSDSQLFSLIGRASYNYCSKYYITFTARDDMSSKFVKGKRSSFFPSIGLSYRLSEENFMKPLKNILDNVKIRYSYGASGNQGIASYATYALLMSANYPFGTSVNTGYAVNFNNPGNSDLTWETTWQHDLGVEMNILHRINLEVDLYRKRTKNLLQYKETAPSTGISRILSNAGAVVNRGLELTLNVNVVRTKDIRFNIGGNIAFNDNNVDDFSESPMFPNTIYNSMRPYAIAKGHSIGSFYGFVYDGIWKNRDEVVNSDQFKKQYPKYDPNTPNSATEIIIARDWVGEMKYADLNKDGFISDEDQSWIGDANPDYTYGFNLDFNYKKFDLSVLLQGVEGNDIFNMNNLRFYDVGETRNIPYYIWRQSVSVNENGSAPKCFYYSGRVVRFSRMYLEDGSYLKVRTLQVGYTWNKPIIPIEKIRFTLTGNNLLTFTNYRGFDPEVNSFGSSPSLKGVDAGAYPQNKSVIFGINITL